MSFHSAMRVLTLSMSIGVAGFSGGLALAQDAAETAAVFEAASLGPAKRSDARIFRYEGPVTVRFTGPSSESHRAWAEAQIGELRALTGLDLQRVDSIGADILVVFAARFADVTDGQYNSLLDRYVAGAERRDALLEGFRQSGAVCAGQAVARGVKLDGGIVFIPRDRLSPVVRSCISAQFARVLGLPFAVPEGAASVLADHSPHSHLTALDRRMLRLLYHPRMRAGTAREDAMTIVRSVLPEITASED